MEDMNAVHVTSDMVAVYGRWCMQWRVVALEVGPESCSLPCPRYLCLLHSHVCAFMIPWHRIAVTGCASCIPVSKECCYHCFPVVDASSSLVFGFYRRKYQTSFGVLVSFLLLC